MYKTVFNTCLLLSTGLIIAVMFLTGCLKEEEHRFPLVSGSGHTETPEIRGFHDDFNRSPGHGIGAWETVSGTWDITFSFDPNRIPYQYALKGKPGNTEAVIMVKELPWPGWKMECAFSPFEDSISGVVIKGEREHEKGIYISVSVKDSMSHIKVEGAGIHVQADVSGLILPGQWHSLVIERWAWFIRVSVDGKTVITGFNAPVRNERPGFFVRAGETEFDDVKITEIPWIADDNSARSIPWSVEEQSRWCRTEKKGRSRALTGESGSISIGSEKKTAEVFIEQHQDSPSECSLRYPFLIPVGKKGGIRVFKTGSEGKSGRLSLHADKGRTDIKRIAIRYAVPVKDDFEIGPYTFSTNRVPDPSDYLDFTPDEIREMQNSGEWDKLKRRQKMKHLVGKHETGSLWVKKSGHWRVSNGTCTGTGPDAVLIHSHEIISEFTMRMDIKLPSSSKAYVSFYAGTGSGEKVYISGKAVQSSSSETEISLPDDGKKHRVVIKAGHTWYTVYLDGAWVFRKQYTQRSGGRIIISAERGTVSFDDILFSIPRRTEYGSIYSFDRRETDWRREGDTWVDHGGIACILASSWISLIAPKSEGMLWNKHSYSPDLAVAFSIEENSEWFGWQRNPSHVHYPFDNIRTALSQDTSYSNGYILEVNSKNRSATVLYRKGKEVARVSQKHGFPIRYRGGHAPYSPRKNRIMWIKKSGKHTVVINGKKVLEYTDPDPLAVKRVGIGGYNTRVNFTHIEIKKLSDS